MRLVRSAPLAATRRQGDAVGIPQGSGSDRASGAARTRRASAGSTAERASGTGGLSFWRLASEAIRDNPASFRRVVRGAQAGHGREVRWVGHGPAMAGAPPLAPSGATGGSRAPGERSGQVRATLSNATVQRRRRAFRAPASGRVAMLLQLLRYCFIIASLLFHYCFVFASLFPLFRFKIIFLVFFFGLSLAFQWPYSCRFQDCHDFVISFS